MKKYEIWLKHPESDTNTKIAETDSYIEAEKFIDQQPEIDGFESYHIVEKK